MIRDAIARLQRPAEPRARRTRRSSLTSRLESGTTSSWGASPTALRSAAAGYRRTLYAFWRRSSAPTFPVRCNAMRRTCEVTPRRTNTPLQALTLLNDRTSVEAARALAEFAWRPGRRRGCSCAWSPGTPSPEEIAVCKREYDRAFAYYKEESRQGRQVLRWRRCPTRRHDGLVANLVLNLDEAITHE